MRTSALALVLSASVVAATPAARPVVETTPAVLTRGPASCHALSFTFDLCPVNQGAGFDAPLVKFLIDHHVHATFFASGQWMDSHEADLKQLLAVPFFEIGTHGNRHAHLPKLSPAGQTAEVQGAIDLLASRYGVHPTLFRPPYGEYNDESVRAATAAGQTVVMWSVVSGDPDPKLPAAAIVADVESRARNGSIIIFHANGRGWHTSEIVPKVYDELVTHRAFATDTISELRAGCRSGDAPLR